MTALVFHEDATRRVPPTALGGDFLSTDADVLLHHAGTRGTTGSILSVTAAHGVAVFPDRDGTVIEDRGDLSDPAQVV